MTTQDRTRRVDSLGRVVLPADLRHALGIREGDVLDVAVNDGQLVLSRHEPKCVFCGTRDDLRERSGRHACGACVSALDAAQ
ncbi:MAG: AbrB/MazE/SpoVT family DNA-binding domain-containing protein [Actinobacteria bacterium]|nr:AbrB/MazE/SpoVT family DNA-binding domain-containing protein [Actinomycetota bacterium]